MTEPTIDQLREWVDGIMLEARTAAESGDLAKLNSFQYSPALKDYYLNVYSLGGVSRSAFFGQVGNRNEVMRLYQADMAEQEAVAQRQADSERLTALEAQNTEIKALLTQLLETQQKPAKKGAKTEAQADESTEAE